MTTSVVVPTVNREITPDLFSDLTDSKWRVEQNNVGEYIFTFGDDLPESMPPFIRDRCIFTPQEEIAREQLLGSVVELTNLAETSVDPDIKLLAECLMNLITSGIALAGKS